MINFKAIALASVIALIPGAAAAQWYAGVDGGVNWTSDDDSLSTGFAGLVNVGYNFGGPKLELEGGYRYNGGEDATFSKNEGYGQTYSLMVNGLYEFMPNEAWHPFVGAGLGFAYVETDIKLRSPLGRSIDGSRSETLFAYQGFLGVSYDINPSFAMRMQYRYFATADAEKVRAGGLTVDTPQNNHSLLAGVSYKFQ